jgi:hypothetical protein
LAFPFGALGAGDSGGVSLLSLTHSSSGGLSGAVQAGLYRGALLDQPLAVDVAGHCAVEFGAGQGNLVNGDQFAFHGLRYLRGAAGGVELQRHDPIRVVVHRVGLVAHYVEGSTQLAGYVFGLLGQFCGLVQVQEGP